MRLTKKDRVLTLDILSFYVEKNLDWCLEDFAVIKPKIPFPSWLAQQIKVDISHWKDTSFTPKEIERMQEGMADYANFVEYNWEWIKKSWLEATPEDKGKATWHHWPLVVYAVIWKIH